jgi:hypothetical protein
MLLLGLPVTCSPAIKLAVASKQPCMLCITKASRRFNQSVEHGGESECRATDELENVGKLGLLIPDLIQLTTKPVKKRYDLWWPLAGAFVSWRIFCWSWRAVAIAPPKQELQTHWLALPLQQGFAIGKMGLMSRQRKRAGARVPPRSARMYSQPRCWQAD